MTVTERLNNEQKRLQTLFVIEPDKAYYVEDGIIYSRETFEEKYPVSFKTRGKEVTDIDSRRKWLYE